jgi:methylthioribose-1-phosphate isomerase
MKVEGKEYRALWFEDNAVKFIDQRKLPCEFEIYIAKTVDDVAFAIKNMVVRGAPSIGAAVVYGMVFGEKEIERTVKMLQQTRPTAHDLFYGIAYMVDAIENGKNALEAAHEYVEDIIKQCRQIGEHGEKLIKDGAKILTHCNAGALATVDYGTALAPLRLANKNGKDIFVYVDETRPRLQGLLTAWELQQEEILHAVIADNAAGYFMKNGDIDLVITGVDRIATNGDIANKIGTYEKAVIAKENDIPFYVAAPTSTFDKSINDGSQIIIEERSRRELSEINGKEIMPNWTKVKNPAFDVTPAKYITGYITENGIKRS